MKIEMTDAEILGEVYRCYQIGDPVSDEQLKVARRELPGLIKSMTELGPNFRLTVGELIRFSNTIDSWHFFRSLR